MKIYNLRNARVLGHTLDPEPHSQMLVEADEISDGHHTFGELYKHRMALFVALCNRISYYDEIINAGAWKSKLHSDGRIPFDNPSWFIAGIQSVHGQISYHLKYDEYWDKLKVPDLNRAPLYDGHTSDDVIERLLKL